MDNYFREFVISLDAGYLFLGDTYNIFQDGLYKIHILWVLSNNIWYDHFIFVKLKISIISVYNIVSIIVVVGDVELHILEFLYSSYVRYYLFDETALNGTKL